MQGHGPGLSVCVSVSDSAAYALKLLQVGGI